MRRKLLLLAFAIILLAGLAFWKSVKWNSQEPSIPIQETRLSHDPAPGPTATAHSAGQSLRLLESQSAGFGNVSGRVIDSTGRPVVNAAVHAWSSPTRMGLIPVAITNSRGIFSFRNLELGKYQLTVQKDYAGYADTENQFYSAGFVEKSTILVEGGKTVESGDLHMGPKAGRLVGTIRDAATNRIIASAPSGQLRKLLLTRVEDSLNSYSAEIDINGNFDVLVPPVPFRAQAIATGYETRDLGIFFLKNGEKRRLDIVLNRSH